MFFSSVLVPKVPSGLLIETLASQRSCPFSMSASETPTALRMSLSWLAVALAASGDGMSGSVTISIKGVPPRLKSTREPTDPCMRPEVPPRDADPELAFRGRDVDVASRTDRLVELGDLVPLRKVGIEVVLPGEDSAVCDLAVEREPGHHPELDGLLVGDGQGPWMAEAHGAGVGVRGIAVGHPAATEHLGRGRQVNVKLEPYDRLVSTLLFHFQMPAPVPDSPAVVFSF